MSLGVAIDVAIGLIFVYLLLSMLASTVQESFAGFLKLRGRQLRDALANLLSGVDANGKSDNKLFQDVFGHSLVTGNTKSNLPTYVSANNFSVALFDALSDGSQGPLFSQIEKQIADLPAGNAKDSLTALLKRTGGDIDQLQTAVQTWFDDAMDRVSGEYKRFAHLFAFLFGLLVAVGLNIDTIDIAKALGTEPNARNALVELATASLKKVDLDKPGDVKTQVDNLQDQLGSLIPMGWQDKDGFRTAVKKKFVGDRAHPRNPLVAILGWLITAVAVSLGAPFWFDMLKNVINLRNAGPKPKRADDKTKTS